MRHTIQKGAIQLQSQVHRSLPRIHLPDPPSLYASLLAIGAEERLAKEMDHTYNTRTRELRSYYENSIDNAFTALADSLHDLDSETIMNAFANLYLTKVKSWIEDGLAAYKSAQKQLTASAEVSQCSNSRRAFNSVYVPLLEHFFSENKFPSHADKAFLAKKSGMTYRQIHVWFQNRRNRTRKPWRTKSVRASGTSPFDSPCDRMVKYTARNDSSTADSAAPNSSQSDGQRSVRKDHPGPHYLLDSNVLDGCDAPLHAFPSSYPPVCAYKPFPPRHGQLLFQWERRPNNKPPFQSSEPDIDALADRFALLNVRDLSSKQSQNVCRVARYPLAATYSITVRPPSAPHPALIQPTITVSSPVCCAPFPVVCAPQSTPQVFVGSMASSPISYLANTISSRRKISSLPKRRPRGSSLFSRDLTPATSVASSSPSPCTPSDTSNFGEERLSSPSSGSSTPHVFPPELQTCPAVLDVPSHTST